MARWFALGAAMVALTSAAPAASHPLPFSTIDIHLEPGKVQGSLTVHTCDLAHELGTTPPERLQDPGQLAEHGAAIEKLLSPRLGFQIDGRVVSPRYCAPQALPDRKAVRVPFALEGIREHPAVLTISGVLFPYDRTHQSFVNIHEHGRLVNQAILDARHPRLEHFAGSAAGKLAAMRQFLGAGVFHILIGLDHVLFLVGLLLLGGSLRQLIWLVSAFTVGHSVTLSLAALEVVSPPARVVEPIIALSIVFVGADNLLARPGARDLRAWIALAFGLVHGFGFAGVLRETGLPARELPWSLFCFNLGVELGQLVVVVVVSFALAALRSRNEQAGRRVARVGSVVVAAAGTFWFFERLFFSGGTS